MKEVIAVVRMNMMNKTKAALTEVGVDAFFAHEAQGRGKGFVNKALVEGAESGYEEAAEVLGEKGKLYPKRMLTAVVPSDLVEEVVDAITAGDDDALAEELGDLLLNLAFQLAIAEEGEAFERRVVWHGLEQKMKRRHPHLFGIGPEESWESLKAREKAPESVLDGLAKSLPPLHRAFLTGDRLLFTQDMAFSPAEPVD